MPWATHPASDSSNSVLDLVSDALDPVLVPLGFAPGQSGVVDGQGQVTFCRGEIESADDACVDLVVDLDESSGWRVVDVRYWGFPSDRWHLEFARDATLQEQLVRLAQTLPHQLA
jgi:hypothetical protein